MREELEQKIHEFAEQMYKAGYEDGRRSSDEYGKGYDEGIDVGYLNGLNDAWECARKIGHLCVDEVFQLFGRIGDDDSVCDICTASEAIAKIKEYEEKKKQTDDEIKVGDVVTVDNVVEEKTAIVTCAKGSFAFILFNDGETACVNVSEIHKTGGNCPVVTMESLRYTQEKMQEEEHEYERRSDV